MKEVNSKAGVPLVLYKSGGPQYKSVCVCVCVCVGGGGGLSSTYVTCDYNSKWWVAHNTLETHDDTE